MARKRGLLLADTKYEFGRLATGQIVVIDEINTADSSRYFYHDQYIAFRDGETEERPAQLSKEFFREWLAEQGFTGQLGQEPPEMPEDIIEMGRSNYQGLFEKMLGHPLEVGAADSEAERLGHMEENIVLALGNLSVAA
jgi:phosphoribosylaminoimidazole-succinocarboxamide synthase